MILKVINGLSAFQSVVVDILNRKNKLSLSFFFAFFFFSFINISFSQNTVDFSASATEGCNALANVQFSDLSTGTINSWHWDFGNNNTSSSQNPTASYSSPGVYTVSLTITGPNGSFTETKNAYIKVYESPVADFTVPIDTACLPLTISFTENSILGDAPIAEYIWDFGDGSPENNQKNPTYTYTSSGNYDVSLQVIDSNGCTGFKLYSAVTVVDRPQPAFSSSNSPNYCAAPYTVNFINYTSAGSSLDYFWDFGDGNTSQAQNPSHTYNSFGSYDVTLIAENRFCVDTLKLLDFASIEPISAQFDIPDTLCWGDTVFFEANTTGASLVEWDFGDGSSSFEKKLSKIYPDSGLFVIELTASSGPNCIAKYKDSIYIQKVIADFFSIDDTFCMAPIDINFQNNSINSNNFIWSINNSIEESGPSKSDFSFNFPVFNTYNMGLYAEDTISGCLGMDSLIIDIYNPQPVIVTDEEKVSGCTPLTRDVDFIYPHNHYDSLTKFTWFINDYEDTSFAQPLSYTFIETGLHSIVLEIENERGCVAYDSMLVAVGDTIPVPPMIYPDTVCAGSNDYFLAPPFNLGADSIKYQTLYTFPPDTIPHIAAVFPPPYKNYYLLSDTGKIYIEQKIEYYGCPNKSPLDSIYINGPIASFNIISRCKNSNVYDFHGIIIGEYSSFKWDFGDGSAPNSSDLHPAHTFPNGLSYVVSLIAYNKDSTCIDTLRQEIFLGPSPEVELYGSSQYCFGDTADFYASVSGRYDSLQWFLNDSLFLQDELFYTLKSKTIKKYKLDVIISNEYGCSDTSSVNVTFSKPEADFKLVYDDGCIPFPVDFVDQSISNYYSIDTVFWNTKPWGLDTNTNVFDLHKVVEDKGIISADLIVQDYFGCRDTISKDSLLLVKDNDLNFWAADKTVCLGDTVFFENFSLINEPHYQWVFGDGDTATGFNIKHLYEKPGNYTVSLKYLNDSICDETISLPNYISVQEKPIADFVADTTEADCYPLPVTFTDLSSGTDINYWSWDFGDGVKSTFQNPFHNYSGTGTFDVTLRIKTSNGCADTIVKPAYIKTSGPTAELNIEPDSACIDQVFTFKMENPEHVSKFSWDFGDGSGSMQNPAYHRYDTSKKIYIKLIVSDSADKCIKPILDSIYIYDVQAIFELSESESCVNTDIHFNNFSIGTTQLSWDFGDGSSSTLSNPVHSYSSPGTYSVSLRIIGQNGCKDTMTKTLLINPLPVVTNLADTFLCFGDSIQLQASGGTTYEWFPAKFLTDPFIENPLAFPDTSTEFTVKAINQYGCADSASFMIEVVSPPLKNYFRDTMLIVGEYLQLYSNNPTHLLGWQPPIWLNCYQCANPLAQPLKTTTYTLSTTDAFGCFSMLDSMLIEVKEAYSVSVPNAFTPNGDGQNDLIFVRGWGIKELLEFKIYNRWGEMVFETSELSEGWDGFYKNKAQDIDTYVYTVKALMYNNEVFNKKGNISLLR